MRQALACAARASGRTFPNPAVGALVYRGDRVLGRGATRPYGGPHAEVVALVAACKKSAARAPRGATLAVTLEPCCFTGRTGPCTEAIIEAGIARVHVGCRDPHEKVAGRGIQKLRAAGIEVNVGVLEPRCREHHRGFFSLCEKKRPFVSLKLATTLDGRIATATGESRWITGAESRAVVHRMRAATDAVMVGSQTAIADDPDLSARRGERIVQRPVRVLVDSRLRLKGDARLYQGLHEDDAPRTWVLCREGARGRRRVVESGARLIEIPGQSGHLDLGRALRALGDAGLTSLLVEGGGGLGAALLRAELVDEIHWFQAPMLLGGDARAALGPLEINELSASLKLENVVVRKVGSDLHIRARVLARNEEQRAGKGGGRTRK